MPGQAKFVYPFLCIFKAFFFHYFCSVRTESIKILNYFRLVKFSHSIFALPFAVIAFFTATQYYHYHLQWIDLLWVIVCMITARNTAMGFNRWADRRIDKQNPRTVQREIPAGKISPRQALTFVIVNAGLFLCATALINSLVLLLAPIALLTITGYSYTKRFTPLSHYFLGLSLAIAPIGAFLVVAGSWHSLPLLLSALVFFWVSGFDIIYALQDINFDRKEGLQSIPARFGIPISLLISFLTHLPAIALVIIIGAGHVNNIWYWAGAVVFSIMLLYQHLIVRPNDLSRVNIAFSTTNGIASLIYAACFITGLFI